MAVPAVYSWNLVEKLVADSFTQKYILLSFPVTCTVSPSWQSTDIASDSVSAINNLSNAPFGSRSISIVPEVIAEASKAVGTSTVEIVIVPLLFVTAVPPPPTKFNSVESTIQLLTFILLSLEASEFSREEISEEEA